jgi:hypothetical protein
MTNSRPWRAALAVVVLAMAAGTLSAKEPSVERLRAGPVRCEFTDGELRYLYVGQKEIVRRIYFAVRDDHWQTPMPTFSTYKVEKTADSFKVVLAASCKSETVSYGWTGEITGKADGTITFYVVGTPGKTFKPNRIGMCVLYGADSLVGQEFEILNVLGKPETTGKWPDLVKMDLVAKEYWGIRYTTADSVTVTVGDTPMKFSMEDQRNYGDSSFKAYSTILTGPEAVAGQSSIVRVTLKVTGAKPAAAPEADGVVKIRLGKAIPGAKMPKLIAAADSVAAGDFLSLDSKRAQLKDQTQVQFGFKPSTHLPDDDTFMENRSGLLWQLKTLHTLAPKAKLRVDPIRLTDAADPRATGPFATAWMIGAIKQLALGGADEACFKVDGGTLAEGLAELGKIGAILHEVEVTAAGRSPIEVLATHTSKDILYISNSTDRPQTVETEPFGDLNEVSVFGLDLKTKPRTKTEGNGVRITLGPYDTCIINVIAYDGLVP